MNISHAEACRRWRVKNAEKTTAYRASYQQENAGERRQANRDWAKNNRAKINAYCRNRYVSKREVKLTRLLRNRLSAAISGRAPKSFSAQELLGCSIRWLQVHLEALFVPGMTWENYGPVWHVDHIKPCALFDLTNQEQQKICFHWTNLQPLFALENLKKSDKYAPPECKNSRLV